MLFRLLRGPAGPRHDWLRGERGSVLTWFAILMVPLLGFTGLAVDTARGYMVRARLSQALDSAALVAGRSTADQTTASEKAATMFRANFPTGYMDAVVSGPTFTFNNTDHTVKATASAVMPTYFMHLAGYDTFSVSVDSTVQRNANSLEIALILDVTGSMSGTKITDLKTAAKNMIDTVVWDDQSQYYSKVAIVPFSMGVNAGTYAAQVRGAVPVKTITGATKANPVVVTSAGHGFNNGDKIFISGVVGMTQINNNLSNSPTATTSPQYWVVSSKTTNTFALTRSDATKADGRNWNTYSSAGTIDCMVSGTGCKYNYFTSASATTNIFQTSNCVSERTGTEAYTDAAPTTALVGRNYPAANNPCLASTILPLTPDKTTLKSKIDSLTVTGSTAGQIGIAWGWYMISPNFGYLWPGSAPAAYGTKELLKIAVIMTDGDFNTAYCSGVIAKDSGSGSGNTSDHINCNATNGSSSSQALSLCAAMKNKGIIVFTVGFALDTQAAKDLLSQCASGPGYAYLASDGAALQEAFRSIAINISRLRLAQ